MRYNKLLLSVILILSMTLPELQAQHTLNVKETSGTLTSFDMSTVSKLTFESGNMMVNKTDGSTSVFALENLTSMNFQLLTAIKEMAGETESGLLLYPNPVKDLLTIRFESLIGKNVQLQLMDIQGKVVFRQTIGSQPGLNNATISLEHLKQGIYVCRLQNGDKIDRCKVLKL